MKRYLITFSFDGSAMTVEADNHEQAIRMAKNKLMMEVFKSEVSVDEYQLDMDEQQSVVAWPHRREGERVVEHIAGKFGD